MFKTIFLATHILIDFIDLPNGEVEHPCDFMQKNARRDLIISNIDNFVSFNIELMSSKASCEKRR